MATRLDRLFLLLETGSTPVIRKSAAEQLGEVQKLHPHELNNLLSKIHGYLQSISWDTRIAAGLAVGAICRNVPQWQPTYATKKEESRPFEYESGRLRLAQFDIQKVLINGASLLGSEGAEYEEEDIGLDEKEKLARQKQNLNRRLGLDAAGGFGIRSDDLFKEEDLVMRRKSESEPIAQSTVQDLLNQQMGNGAAAGSLSARERNRAKRKAKLLAKQVSKDDSQKNGDGSDSEPAAKVRKTTSVVVQQPGDEDKIVLDNIPDNTLNMEEIDEWPFDVFCEILMNDLFNEQWERRHGAATGLREVMKIHGTGAGKATDMSLEESVAESQLWLEDLAVRLICVVALDRFGDFVSDEVVAPVRETCAQTLGVTLQHMSAASVERMVSVLLQLLTQRQWEVRHGGLLGLKYLLAVRKDLAGKLLPLTLPAMFCGLQDQDDDVRGVAAAALLPVTDILVTTLSHQIPQIIECLWYTLLDLDDLTASTTCIMTLLSTLLSHPQVPAELASGESLKDLVPRLWPFLKHNIAAVRKASLQTLYTLLTRQTDKELTAMWLVPILQEGMRHIYQRCLIENKLDILDLIKQVWQALIDSAPLDYLYSAAGPWMGVWLCLMMQPINFPFEPTLLIEAKHAPKVMTPSRVRHTEQQGQEQSAQAQKEHIGGYTSLSESPPRRDITVMRARLSAARLLGMLCARLSAPFTLPEGMESPGESISRILLFHLASKSALQRLAIGLLMTEWAKLQQDGKTSCPQDARQKLQETLVETIYYDEIAMTFTRLQTECKDFVACLQQQEITSLDAIIQPGSVLTLEQAEGLCTTHYDSVRAQLQPRQQPIFDSRRQSLLSTVQTTAQEQQLLSMRVQSSLAGAAIWLRDLPEKMNPVVRPLMEMLKKEQNPQLQDCAAASLSQLLMLCVERAPSPNPKVMKNLCSMLSSDPAFTPVIGQESQGMNQDVAQEFACDKHSGILTLSAQQVKPVTGRGRKQAKMKTPGVHIDITEEEIFSQENEAKRLLLIQRRGSTSALTTLVRNFGADLPCKLSSLWDGMMAKVEDEKLTPKNEADVQNIDLSDLKTDDPAAAELVGSLQLLEVVSSEIDTTLHKKLEEKLLTFCCCLQHPYTAVRHITARCLAVVSKVMTSPVLHCVLRNVLPLLGTNDDVTKRQGAIETLNHIIEQLGMDVIPYIVLLVVPVLGAMSDQDEPTRLMATACFATLIRLMPLEAGIPDPESMPSDLIERKEKERRFLEQLLDGSKIADYVVPVPIKAELRTYQQDGVNWLSFLNTYKLHGILCDDMGLGKTLQSICILAGDHCIRAQKYKETGHAEFAPLPSIVVCPPTLTGHWVYEVEKFIESEYLNPLHYTGPPQERIRLQKKVKKHNLIVASYDVVRNDIDFFSKIRFNYCILDEGHIIKNSKTKLSRAVKRVPSNHRLILSGTPIQNNVLELWSLFDFLIPGFLGTEKQFQARYGRPILQSRDAKSSSKEQEAGALAMESLHRQVLPFLLRRLKEDVLKDLPPKIIQDYYCDLSPLQVQLYEDFAKSRAKKSVDDSVQGGEESPEKKPAHGNTHIFQALQYLRKVCNHPALVLLPQHPEYSRITGDLKRDKSSLRDLQHAPKLTALKQLLNDCGIGLTGPEADDAPVVNQHRVLLFCQLKSMLDIVEKDLLKGQMHNVSYLRLDGSVPAGNRHAIVNRFNNDPSIDMLLLTTHVGGLGLNLTGADTVIFVEHDWNPMKDLQAMDRAHRIGQKKVVNVYRLITRGTLEEKIMGLQKFKLNIANSVISAENSSLASMGTDQLLDLFSLEETKTRTRNSQSDDTPAAAAAGGGGDQKGIKSVLDTLDDLWDEKQYENEYDLSSFMSSLKK